MTDLTQVARLDSSLLHTGLLAGARQVGGIYQLDFQTAGLYRRQVEGRRRGYPAAQLPPCHRHAARRGR